MISVLQSITQNPKFAPCISDARNEDIAMHFNDKLTSMEYILYNVAVVESDIYNGSKNRPRPMRVHSLPDAFGLALP